MTFPRPLRDPAVAREFLVDPGHDSQQRRFAGTVDAEDADLGVGIERKIDVFQYLAVARIGLGQPLHVIDELSGHRGLPSLQISGKFGADVTMPEAKGKRSPPRFKSS